MTSEAFSTREWILLTGVTGFVGQGLAREFLARGHRLLCLVRAAAPADARRRLVDALRPWDLDADALLESGRLAVLRGDLHQPAAGVSAEAVAALAGRVRALVHAAGSTRFAATASGEPHRTNVDGGRRVLELARAVGCRDWHWVSTAYVAGRCAEAHERAHASPQHRNTYEQSKWQAEGEARATAAAHGASLTIYRPSIVVGEHATGRATRFSGVYLLMRATAMVAAWADQDAHLARRAIPLEIPTWPDDALNLIALDDLTRTFADLFESPAARGGIYHLTHPDPPTHDDLKQALERHYRIGGGRFCGPTKVRSEPRLEIQRVFDELITPVAEYLFQSPRFDRTNAARLETRAPRPWTREDLVRLIAYAESVNWRPVGRLVRDGAAGVVAAGIAAYFRDFMPARVASSTLGAVGQLDVDVQFRIGDTPDGSCWCRFRGGRLADVRAGAVLPADVVYRTGVADFWAAVGGEVSGAELFLSGAARIEGDIERALKLAVLLDSFVRECPYPGPVSRGAAARRGAGVSP